MIEKLTVAEYAEKHSITKQAVYKKINNLNTVEEDRNGRKVILIVEEDKNTENKELNQIQPNLNPIFSESQPAIQPNSTTKLNSIQPNLNPDIQPDSTREQNDELNPSIIEILKNQLEEKDKQIQRLQEAEKEKDQQLQEQFERFTALLMRSQELEALTHKLLLDQGEEQEPPKQEPPKKYSFWSRLFRR